MAYEMKKTDTKVMTLSAVQEKLIKDFNEEIKTKQLEVPDNYSASNAIKFAVIDIRKLGLDKSCNMASIGKALSYMIRLGLDPTKKQCYFWSNKVYEGYGNSKHQIAADCDMFKSYFGDEACAYRTGLVEPNGIMARPIYKDDTFKTATNKNNQMIIIDHNTAFENLDKPIIGGYCVIKLKDGSEVWTVMTMKEINVAWSKAKNSGAVQQEFPQEMVKRTLIRRCCKNFFNANPVADTIAQNKLIQTYNEATEKEYDNTKGNDVVADLDEEENGDNALPPVADDNGEIKPVEEKKEDINQAKEVQTLFANMDKEGK